MANAKRVRSLAEALEVASEIEGVVGFHIAPLATINGGRRSWHGIDPRDENKWMPEAATTDDVEPNIPSPFEPVESFPELPPSRIGLWEVSFLASSETGSDLVRLPNRVLIELPRRNIRDAPSEPFASAPFVTGDLNGSVVAMMAQQNKFTLDMFSAQQRMLSTLSDEQQKLTASIREQQERTQKDLIRTQQERDVALGSNSQLALQVSELKSESQIGMVVGKLIEKDPKLLFEGLGNAASAIIALIRGSDAA